MQETPSYISKSRLDELVTEGWLVSQNHPSLDLTVYNYSRLTEFEGNWTPETLMCRGLVVNSEGQIVARPFPKFFNAHEVPDQIPNLPFECFEKVDGSLGIAFHYKGELVFTSRGSFTSEQALRGREILNKYAHETGMYPGYTYLFEIIYPENRVVVNYGDLEELFVLAVIETATGEECDYQEMASEGFVCVKKYDFKEYQTIKELAWENSEGFVIRFSNGFRIKIKFDEYLRLHRILTNVSTKSIWEVIRKKMPLDEIIERVPDESYDWVKETVRDLHLRYDNVLRDYTAHYEEIVRRVGVDDRKAFAAEARRFPHPEILFNMLDGKDNWDAIWKFLRPKWEKPFRNPEP